ncbi:MAG: SOS response-associated peptidase [Gammaproteobacteria bacterium]|jgi:putative SOS response-associated peptidase YedK|nr:SOS response-associated peptidase [Gammaproteobacteria bacterium]MDP6617628.1 SOS response-associated peptidase [Gammaproteobacteria bacterium]MDP6694505.1 SOS response-associated peptidase [Gammaproteobacteria bacterium]MDP7041085.1 SOS response-associated peptidase [Gammaproteobacteria bacterium]
MCGRFAFFSPVEAVQQAFGVDIEAAAPRYNIAPTQYVNIIRLDESGELTPDSCRWGLVPFWAKDPDIGNRMINARAETIGEKPAYRQAFSRRRCLVLASGFYEWHTDDSGKWPWFIARKDRAVFGMAGLWELWEKGEGEDLKTCTIVTRPATEFMARLHHRMPVIMDSGDIQDWLQPGAAAEKLSSMLLGEVRPELDAWKVSRRVNNPVNDAPELIERQAD